VNFGWRTEAAAAPPSEAAPTELAAGMWWRARMFGALQTRLPRRSRRRWLRVAALENGTREGAAKAEQAPVAAGGNSSVLRRRRQRRQLWQMKRQLRRIQRQLRQMRRRQVRRRPQRSQWGGGGIVAYHLEGCAAAIGSGTGCLPPQSGRQQLGCVTVVHLSVRVGARVRRMLDGG